MQINTYFTYNRAKKISGIVILTALLFPWSAWPAFYQAVTLANYCKEYLRMIDLDNPVNQLEAGICSGYTASKIEVMNLSGQLCQRDKINLDDVVKDYIEFVESDESLQDKSATYAMVDLLQRKYACVDDN